MKDKLKDIIFKLSAVLIVLSAILYSFQPQMASYMMIVAVLAYIVCVFATRYPGKSIRGKRLHNMNAIAAILMAVSAYLMFVQNKVWVLCLFIAAILTLYSTIMINKVLKEESQKNDIK